VTLFNTSQQQQRGKGTGKYLPGLDYSV
jgi:hypothetical protein